MFPSLLQQGVKRHDKEAAERAEQQQQGKRRQQRLLDGEKMTATPINIPAGMQRDTVSSVTSFAAAPAPSTIPTATIALR